MCTSNIKEDKSVSMLTIPLKGFTAPNLPIATFTQNEKELNFLVDTGSEYNSIDKNILEKIKHKKIKDNSVTRLIGVGGTQDVSACEIPFQFEGKDFEAKFLVTDFEKAFNQLKKLHGIQLHGLIGAKFLVENNIVLDFKNLIAHNNDSSGH